MPRSIEVQIRATYRSLRAGAAIIAIAFPLLLWAGGKLAHISLRSSMSDYYWATADQPCPCGEEGGVCIKARKNAFDAADTTSPTTGVYAGTMRNWFVGLLFATGAILYVNRGYSNKENIALNLAGVLAWGIAIFPENWTCVKGGFSMHGFCAISFFLAIAFVSVFCSNDTLQLIDDQKKRVRFKRTYRLLAGVMIASPFLAYGFNFFSGQNSTIYWIELFGIDAFAFYWIVKSREIWTILDQRKKQKLTLRTEESLVPAIY